MSAITIIKPVRFIKRSLMHSGRTYIHIHIQLSALGFTVHKRAPTNIDALLTGLPKTVLDELANRIATN